MTDRKGTYVDKGFFHKICRNSNDNFYSYNGLLSYIIRSSLLWNFFCIFRISFELILLYNCFAETKTQNEIRIMVCGMCEAPHTLFHFYQSSEIHMHYIQFIYVSLTGSTACVAQCLSVARLQLKFKCYRAWMLHAFSVHLAYSEMTSATGK